jgi:hypothetical protein
VTESVGGTSVPDNIVVARRFEEVLEMFERATKKSEDNTGLVKDYWDKLCSKLNVQLAGFI